MQQPTQPRSESTFGSQATSSINKPSDDLNMRLSMIMTSIHELVGYYEKNKNRFAAELGATMSNIHKLNFNNDLYSISKVLSSLKSVFKFQENISHKSRLLAGIDRKKYPHLRGTRVRTKTMHSLLNKVEKHLIRQVTYLLNEQKDCVVNKLEKEHQFGSHLRRIERILNQLITDTATQFSGFEHNKHVRRHKGLTEFVVDEYNNLRAQFSHYRSRIYLPCQEVSGGTCNDSCKIPKATYDYKADYETRKIAAGRLTVMVPDLENLKNKHKQLLAGYETCQQKSTILNTEAPDLTKRLEILTKKYNELCKQVDSDQFARLVDISAWVNNLDDTALVSELNDLVTKIEALVKKTAVEKGQTTIWASWHSPVQQGRDDEKDDEQGDVATLTTNNNEESTLTT